MEGGNGRLTPGSREYSLLRLKPSGLAAYVGLAMDKSYYVIG